MRRRTSFFFWSLVLTLAMGVGGVAEAQRTPRRGGRPQHTGPSETEASGEAAGPAPTIEDLGTIVPRLSSANSDEVREAIDQLSVIDDPRVIPPIVDMLRTGQPDVVQDRALDALRGLAHPSSIDILTEFTRHRRPGARRRAYLALAAIQDPRVRPLLEQGLRDSDRQVRATCAEQLGRTGARASLDLLFRAFDRGVIEAASAIGRLGDVHAVERFDQHLGHAPLSVMLSGYEQFLTREDIPEDAKIEIIGRLGEVSGRTVREFLGQYLARFNERDRSRLRTVVRDTLARIPADAPARPGASATPPAAPAATGGAR